MSATAPPWTTRPLSRVDFARHAGAALDFNPMHLDEDFAVRAGYPSVLGQGVLAAGILAHYLTDWLGVDSLRRFRVRFQGQLWPGDELVVNAWVVALRDGPSGGVVDGEATVATARSGVIQRGWFTAAPTGR